jgi:hypothetical protein
MSTPTEGVFRVEAGEYDVTDGRRTVRVSGGRHEGWQIQPGWADEPDPTLPIFPTKREAVERAAYWLAWESASEDNVPDAEMSVRGILAALIPTLGSLGLSVPWGQPGMGGVRAVTDARGRLDVYVGTRTARQDVGRLLDAAGYLYEGDPTLTSRHIVITGVKGGES